MEKNRVIIIAEAGVNHNGDIKLAKQLIDIAAWAGADIVKFQTFKTENLVTKNAEMASYQKENTGISDTQFAMLKKLELSENDFLELKEYSEIKNIRFLSTGFDLESLAFLKKLGLNIWKIPSGELNNLPYLEYIGCLNTDIILSTGMANMEEIQETIGILNKSGTPKNKITVLHCNTDYPTKMEDVNLNAMVTIRNQLGVNVGYSDHTPGVEVAVAATALGALVIEKHFTLNKNLPGPDHLASLDPNELKSLVTQVRNIEKALGRSEKIPTESEYKNIKVARKSIVAKCDILKGDIFSESNLTTKRPGYGLSPMKWYEVLGKRATRNFKKDENIEC